MHEWAKKILECVKVKAESIGIENFEGQNLDDLKDWTEIAKNIACFDKDFKIVEAMKKAEENDDIMEMLEQYEDYPERRYYDHYRYSDGRFAPKGRGTYRRGYEGPYWRMTPEMYKDMQEYRDMDRNTGRMYYTEPSMTMSESNYDRAKRNYTETKELHRANTPQDKEAKMRGLEDYFKEISSDITGMLSDMTPEERNMLKSKISALATKL
jgi:hypothetical protein|nr:MAG TPA: hypothetical protein [Caudoviricetes sp.]